MMQKIKLFLVCFMAGVMAFSFDVYAKTFPVGALFPMTGPQAYYGRVMSRGAKIGVSHVNAEGSVEYKFRLVITDFKNVDVILALSGVQKMSIIDKAPCVMTSFSAITLGAQPACASAKMLMINGGAYSPKLANKPYLYNIKLSQNQMVPPMLKYFWDMGVRKLGVIHIADPAGQVPVEQLVKPLWKEMGGEIVATESHQPGLTDYTPYLSKIKAGNPDAIYDISTGQDQAFIIKGVREMGMDIPMTVPDWNDDWNEIAGKASENVFVPGDHFDTARSDPLTSKFVNDYKARWNELPDIFAANYYDAVRNILPVLIKRVVKKGGNPLSGEELEKAIWEDPSFDSVYGGKIKFNKDGSSDKPMMIFRLVNGKKTPEKQITTGK